MGRTAFTAAGLVVGLLAAACAHETTRADVYARILPEVCAKTLECHPLSGSENTDVRYESDEDFMSKCTTSGYYDPGTADVPTRCTSEEIEACWKAERILDCYSEIQGYTSLAGTCYKCFHDDGE